MSQTILIMMDGLRPDAISEERTPTLCSVMERGSYTLEGQSVVPSITLPCHTSIFHSIPPARHGIIDNDWHSMARPVTGLVEHLKQNKKRSGFVYNWENLRNISSVSALYYSFFIDKGYELDGDDYIVEHSKLILNQDLCDFWFLYFASIDMSGHMFAWMSDGYLKQVNLVDNLVGQVLKMIPDTSTVIIHADHGGHERTHGTENPDDMIIPWMIMGPNIRQNYVIQAPVSLLSTAPTIAHSLGIIPHDDWEGLVVEEVFI
jgi:predicted AlkP superfamily pyrophosphatase or phosphodiesterase